MGSTPMKFNSFQEAFRIAQEAHKDQVDLSGISYINHPIIVSTMVNGSKEKIVAILHDVFEDSNIKVSDLKDYFSKDIIDALEVISRPKDLGYKEYIERLAKNNLARKVKIADLTHNMDLRRLDSITPNDIARLKKYHQAYKFLVNYEKAKS